MTNPTHPRDLPGKWREAAAYIPQGNPEYDTGLADSMLILAARELEASLPLAERLASALEAVEWHVWHDDEWGHKQETCPECHESVEHEPDCQLASALEGWRSGEPAEAVHPDTKARYEWEQTLCKHCPHDRYCHDRTECVWCVHEGGDDPKHEFQPADTEANR